MSSRQEGGQTIAELLSADETLASYGNAFESAGIDVALAATMQLHDLREFLPHAPIAHCLLLKRLFRASDDDGPALKPMIVSIFTSAALLAAGLLSLSPNAFGECNQKEPPRAEPPETTKTNDMHLQLQYVA